MLAATITSIRKSALQFGPDSFSQVSYLKSTLRERMTTKSFPPKPHQFKTILARFDVPSTRKLNKNTTQTNHTTTHETGRRPAAQTQSPGSSSTPKHPSAARRDPSTYGTGSLRNPPTPDDPDPGLTGAWGRCRRGAWTDPPAGCPRAPAPPSESRTQPRRLRATNPSQIRGRNGRERSARVTGSRGNSKSGSFIEIGRGVGEEGKQGEGS